MELELEHSHHWDNAKGDHTTTMIIGRVKLIHLREDIIDLSGGIVSVLLLQGQRHLTYYSTYRTLPLYGQ